MANRVKELDADIYSNLADTVARITYMGGVDRQSDLSAAEILHLEGDVYKTLVIPLKIWIILEFLPNLWARLMVTAGIRCELMVPRSKPPHRLCVSS